MSRLSVLWCATVSVAAFSLACIASTVSAQSATTDLDTRWIADANGCKVRNAHPTPNESITWSGSCHIGYADGDGTVQWYLNGQPNGTSAGIFRQGKMVGKGVTVGPDGTRYDGDYIDGLRWGRGIQILVNGARYEGLFVDNKFNGMGKLFLPNGDRYEGQFVDGKRSGQGRYTWSNGGSYEGQFADAKMHGHGVMTAPNGTRQDVQFVQGKRVPVEANVAQSTAAPIFGESNPGAAVRSGQPRAAGSIDGHSVDAIRAALRSPISANILKQAQDFDDTVARTGMVSGQRIALVTDARSAHATEVVRKLLGSMNIDPSKWIVRVLDTNPPVENAFVAGGRYLYLYTGLINNVSSVDELAFVLGHEISHALLQQQLRRGEDITNLLGSLLELGGALSRRENTKEGLTLVGGSIKAVYSRADEQEADALGVYLATRAGFEPMRAVEFFNRSIRTESAEQAKLKEQLTQLQQNTHQAIASCNQVRAQWNSSALYRTQRNAQVVNSTCQDAQTKATGYSAITSKISQQLASSVLLRTHPIDQQRIAFIVATTDYLRGRRPLDSLAASGQGYNVLLAISHE